MLNLQRRKNFEHFNFQSIAECCPSGCSSLQGRYGTAGHPYEQAFALTVQETTTFFIAETGEPAERLSRTVFCL